MSKVHSRGKAVPNTGACPLLTCYVEEAIAAMIGNVCACEHVLGKSMQGHVHK